MNGLDGEKTDKKTALIEECQNDLLKVKKRLEIGFEDGCFPGEKLRWCRDRIEWVISALNMIKNEDF